MFATRPGRKAAPAASSVTCRARKSRGVVKLKLYLHGPGFTEASLMCCVSHVSFNISLRLVDTHLSHDLHMSNFIVSDLLYASVGRVRQSNVCE